MHALQLQLPDTGHSSELMFHLNDVDTLAVVGGGLLNSLHEKTSIRVCWGC